MPRDQITTLAKKTPPRAEDSRKDFPHLSPVSASTQVFYLVANPNVSLYYQTSSTILPYLL